jgi:hypothetical protein
MAKRKVRGEDKKKLEEQALEAKFEEIYAAGYTAGKLNDVPDPIYKEGSEEYSVWMSGWKTGFEEIKDA